MGKGSTDLWYIAYETEGGWGLESPKFPPPNPLDPTPGSDVRNG